MGVTGISFDFGGIRTPLRGPEPSNTALLFNQALVLVRVVWEVYMGSVRCPFSRGRFPGISLVYMGVSKNRGGPPKWMGMVKIMENPIKIDDLGGNIPLFLG